MDYLESWYSGDSAKMAGAIHPELAKRFVRTIVPGSVHLDECGSSKLIAWTASGEGTKIPFEYQRIIATVLNYAPRVDGPDLAVVKLTSATGVEYLQEGQVGNEWKIINILSEERAAAPFRLSLFEAASQGEDKQKEKGQEAGRVRKMAMDYIRAYMTGDTARLGGALHPQFSEKCLRPGPTGHFFLEVFGSSKFITWASYHGRNEDDSKVQVTVLDNCRDMASVKIVWGFDNKGQNPTSLEYVDGVKIDGTWKAVNGLAASGPIAESDWSTWQW
jgi:hypothetical protein